MTNAEIIAKIRAEVERRLANYHPEFVNHGLASGFREDGKAIAYEELLSFLSDLEKSAKPVNLDEEIGNYFKYWTEDKYTGAACHYQYVNLNDCRGIARRFAEWGAEHAREQMMEEAVEIGTTEICWVPDGDRVFPTFDPPVEDLLMPGIISQRFNGGDKVRVIIVKEG